MRSVVLYSSRTGNTRMVARAIYEELDAPKEIFPVEEAPPLDEYDFVALGYWVDKGMPDAAAQKCLKTIQGKLLGLFGTLGAEPDSQHAWIAWKRRGKWFPRAMFCWGFSVPGAYRPQDSGSHETHGLGHSSHDAGAHSPHQGGGKASRRTGS